MSVAGISASACSSSGSGDAKTEALMLRSKQPDDVKASQIAVDGGVALVGDGTAAADGFGRLLSSAGGFDRALAAETPLFFEAAAWGILVVFASRKRFVFTEISSCLDASAGLLLRLSWALTLLSVRFLLTAGLTL
jgi:hypothetical protein